MKIELNDDSVDQYGRQIQLYVDDEGAEVVHQFVGFVNDLEEGTKPNTTDQRDVTRQ